jgi:hypothetical protein
MTVNVGVMQILTRTAGVRVAAAAAIAAGLLMTAAPASAAPASAATILSTAAQATAAQAPARTFVYQTLVDGLAVRAATSATSMKRAVLGAAGTKVRVRCYAVGQSVNGDNVWYRITAPSTGVVVGFYLNTGSDPALGIPRCAGRFWHVYRTLVTGLAVRKAASSTSTKRAALGTAGTEVSVRCYAVGESVSGDGVWYRITAPRAGMVSGFYLNTGRDPATGIRHC